MDADVASIASGGARTPAGSVSFAGPMLLGEYKHSHSGLPSGQSTPSASGAASPTSKSSRRWGSAGMTFPPPDSPSHPPSKMFTALKGLLSASVASNPHLKITIFKRFEDALAEASELPALEDVAPPESPQSESEVLSKEEITRYMRGMAESDRDRMGWTIGDVKRTSGSKGSYRKAASSGSKAKSSLHTASKAGDVGEIRAIFASDKNTQVNSRDLLGQTPLHYAAMSGSDEVVLELLAHGAEIDLQDDLGETALNRACSRTRDAHHPVVRALLQKGADAYHKDSHGRCAVDILGVEALDVKQSFDEQRNVGDGGGGASSSAAKGSLGINERIKVCSKGVLQRCLASLKQHGLTEAHTVQVLHAAMMAAKDLPSAPRLAARPRIDSKEVLASFDVSGSGGTPGASVLDRYRGALLGIAVGEAIGLACEGVQLRSLGALHEYIGGPHGSISSQLAASGDVSLHVLSSNLGVAIGAWSDWGVGAMCAAQSVTALQRHDVGDVMMRLLRVYRTGRGACRPGRCPGMDAATRAGLEAHERHGWRAGHVPRSTLGPSGEASASHLARAVPSCLLLALSSPAMSMSSAGDSARATNDNVVSVDASRYFAGLICGSVRALDTEGRPQTPAEIKKVILTERYSPVPDMWASKPLSQEMRHVSDGGFKSEGGGVSASERNSASGALGLAMWALHKTDSIGAGVELLMQTQAGRAAMSVFCSLAGSIYGYNELPHVWVEILKDKKEWLSLADRIHDASVSLPPPSGPSLETPNKATLVISTTRIGRDM